MNNLDENIKAKKEQAQKDELPQLVERAHNAIEKLNSNHWLLNRVKKILPISLDSYGLQIKKGMSVVVGKDSVNYGGDRVFEFKKSLSSYEVKIFKNDDWVEPLKEFMKTYDEVIKEMRLRRENEKKAEQEENERMLQEIQKRDFGLEDYDKKLVVKYERRAQRKQIIRTFKILVASVAALVGIGVFLLFSLFAILLTGFWSIFIIPIGGYIIFSVVKPLMDWLDV